MRERFHLDAYNAIIIVLIPAILLTAWGLTTVYERDERARQCDEAVTYLDDVADLAPLYTSADSIDDAADWADGMAELSPPEPAEELHDGAISALNWASTVGIDVATDEPGALYDELPAFRDILDDGRETLVSRCPDTATMIPEAFPMYFSQEGQ